MRRRPDVPPNAATIGRSGTGAGGAPQPPPEDGQAEREETGAHRLPDHVMWRITLLTAVGMAVLNFVTINCMRTLVKWKFSFMQSTTDQAGVLRGAVALIATAAFLATCAMCIIFGVEPEAGSSGVAENRGWLNGNRCGNIFTKRTLVVRGIATILGNGAGYPVGREGPTVTMGSNLAFLITGYYTQPYAKKWVAINARTRVCMADEDRIAAAERVACAVGGACGMAMIFDSPIGGILYMFEELTASCWPVELTFRAFVGTIACALLSKFMLNFLCSTDTKAFVVYEWSPQRHVWDWWDLPVIVFIAAVLGPFSALHTHICLKIGSARQALMKSLQRFQPFAKIVDAILYAAFCASVCSAVAINANCEPLRPGDARELVRYNCPHGYYNPVASLLLTTSEGAVNLLFSRRNDGEIHPDNALLALVAYTMLNVGLTGLPIPSGNFTGSMLIGGLVGRCLGAVTQPWNPAMAGPASSGVYAMVGAAAMLCGFKRMSLAVVWFVSIASNDFNLVPPLMLAVMVSVLLARACKERGYDEEMVLRRNVLFLDPEPPHAMDALTALHLCDTLPEEAMLPPEASASAVRLALQQREVTDFPVIREGCICIGFTTRDRLERALQACETHSQSGLPGGRSPDGGAGEADFGFGQGEEAEVERLIQPGFSSPTVASLPGVTVPVAGLVDPVPYTILQAMPAPRMYALFARAGVSTACVVGDGGIFKGMVSRAGLIQKARAMEE